MIQKENAHAINATDTPATITEQPEPEVEQSLDRKSIDLDVPINCGNRTISTLVVRRPNSGALRGLKLFDVVNMDVTSIQTLLPRITEPALIKAEVMTIDPADLVTLGITISSFLGTRAERSASL